MATQVKTQGEWIRGTAKQIRKAGIDLTTTPFLYGGTDITGPVTAPVGLNTTLGARFERVEIDRTGVNAYNADNRCAWLGGVATRFWVKAVTEAPHASEVEDEGAELEGLTFPQLMEIAKQLKVPGRGTARKPQLIAGIIAARIGA